MTPPLWVLAVAAAVLAAVSALLLLGLLLGTVVRHWRRRRDDRVHQQLQPLLRQLVVDGSQMESASWWLRRLSWRAQVGQLSELARTLSGEGRRRVTQLAEHTGVLARSHRLTRSRRWHRRLRGARVLTLVGAGETALPGLLGDPHPEVRAQGADWVAVRGTEDDVATMLHTLDGDDQLGRYTLVDCLARAGPRATPALAAFLDRDDVRDPVPALTAATELAGPSFAPVAARWSHAAAPAARAAAVRMLASLGDHAAVDLVRQRLTDEDERVRVAAADGLGRLQYWPAAPELADALGDPVFPVRRAAGLALRRLGATGGLYLRRILRAEDGFAADMAQQVLSLPDEVAA